MIPSTPTQLKNQLSVPRLSRAQQAADDMDMPDSASELSLSRKNLECAGEVISLLADDAWEKYRELNTKPEDAS